MAALYFIVTLLIQSSLTETIKEDGGNSFETGEDFNATNADILVKDYTSEPYSWMDAFIESSSELFPSPSATLMTQVTNSDQSPEEKLENIKEIVNQIASSIQSEMDNLMSDAMYFSSDDETNNKLRKKRSIETPMDSTQLLNRLLKHIIANNEYQNVAIQKLMSAQEIADKYGINFSPDPETLSDLALAAHEQAKEMSGILQDAMELKNVTLNDPEVNEKIDSAETNQIDSAEVSFESIAQNEHNQNNSSDYSLNFEIPKENNLTDRSPISNYNYYNYCPVETQIFSPVPQHYNPPVSQMPSFYDLVSDNSPLDYYCSMEPATTIIVSNDEPGQAEPELVAEEYEETVSSKVFINYEEAPDVSTVNHVTSYTISEKAHFRTPHIESLPQQMQYYFLLI